MVKLRFLLGLASKIAEINGVIQFLRCARLWARWRQKRDGGRLVESMEVSGSQYGKTLCPMAAVSTPQWCSRSSSIPSSPIKSVSSQAAV